MHINSKKNIGDYEKKERETREEGGPNLGVVWNL
jgi:hypothetical protein